MYPHVRALPLPFTPRLLTILWQRLRLPLAIEYFTGRVDIVHAPDFVLPPTRARTLLTVHDLTFLTQPTCFEPALQRYLARVVPRSLRRASLVLADSQATRQDLAQYLGVPPERSVVLYPGISPRFRPLPPTALAGAREQLGLPASVTAFLLFVGTLEPRKNLVRLLEAFHIIRQQPAYAHLSLVIAGRKGWLYQDIFATYERLNLASHVHFLDFVDDEMLPALYNLAEGFIYPSLYEGFGLPVAEAMACGTPVVTTNAASLPEVAGDSAIMVNPYDSQALAMGIQQALQEQTRLRAAGPKQVRRFVWEQSARALLACYMHGMQL
jgi:glycosyltransferase involved in cell wall biosynthesis